MSRLRQNNFLTLFLQTCHMSCRIFSTVSFFFVLFSWNVKFCRVFLKNPHSLILDFWCGFPDYKIIFAYFFWYKLRSLKNGLTYATSLCWNISYIYENVDRILFWKFILMSLKVALFMKTVPLEFSSCNIIDVYKS